MVTHSAPRLEHETVTNVRIHSGSRALRQDVHEWSTTPVFEWPAWKARAACRDIATADFFPNTSAESGESYKYLRRLCGDCEVRMDCLTAALDGEEMFGLWAGTSPRERRRALNNPQFRQRLERRVQIGDFPPTVARQTRAYPRTYGDRAAAMHAQGVPQNEIADELGVSGATISKWLSYRRGGAK